jgi:hypothetical protein
MQRHREGERERVKNKHVERDVGEGERVRERGGAYQRAGTSNVRRTSMSGGRLAMGVASPGWRWWPRVTGGTGMARAAGPRCEENRYD